MIAQGVKINMKNLMLKMTSSKLNYYLSIAFDLMTALLFFVLALRASNDMAATVALFLVGAIFFTFLEYAVHAWLFHLNHPFKVFIEGHAHHHQNPFSYDALPFFFSFIISLVLVMIFSLFISTSSALAIVGGITLGYFNYGVMHHLMHRVEFKSNYWRYMQEFHFIHHKKPLMNNGITTDIWDRVFGTYYQWSPEELKGIESLKRMSKEHPIKAVFDTL